MKRSTIVDIISLLFMALFVYTGVSKFMDFEKFRVELGKSPLLTAFAGWVAWIIPAAEILLAVLLVIPLYRLIALYLSFSLMIMFTTYLIVILNFSFYVPCTCSGIIQNMSWQTHIIFNTAFIILAVIAVLLYQNAGSRGPPGNTTSTNSIHH